MSTSELTADQQSRIQELDKLKADGVIDQAEYDEAVGKVHDGAIDEPPDDGDSTAPDEPSDEEKFQQEQAAAAAAQSPGEAQTVPEQRPIAAANPSSDAGVSDASKRIDQAAEPMGKEAYDRANSDEQKKSAAENSRMPNLIEGQRVQIVGDHPEAGRMAYILQVHYTDGIQDMIAKSGTAEARFADVDHYVLRTRDGRSDLLTVKPDEVKPLDDIQGWGRGQI